MFLGMTKPKTPAITFAYNATVAQAAISSAAWKSPKQHLVRTKHDMVYFFFPKRFSCRVVCFQTNARTERLYAVQYGNPQHNTWCVRNMTWSIYFFFPKRFSCRIVCFQTNARTDRPKKRTSRSHKMSSSCRIYTPPE